MFFSTMTIFLYVKRCFYKMAGCFLEKNVYFCSFLEKWMSIIYYEFEK